MDKITNDEWDQIRNIQDVLGIVFTGKSEEDAKLFIKKYSKWVDEYLDECIF